MSQLKMYWKCEKTEFPEPYGTITYRTYNGSREDRLAWLNICKNGLVADDADEEEFNSRFYSKEYFTDDDLYLVFDGDNAVATVCGIFDCKTGIGNVHMVSVSTASRGKGLGGYVNQIVKAHLWRDGCCLAYLTTDEWRVPAIKSYLSAGFLPVDYDEDMPRRWEVWLSENGYKNITMLSESGDFAATLCEEKI